MQAALLQSPHHVELREIPSPQPAAGQVLIRPVLAGICGSDLSFFAGHRAAAYPHILGHEVVGTVEALGAGVTGYGLGSRVLVEPNYPCGACAFCRSGRGCICPHKLSMGVNLPGCFAELTLAPEGFVWPVPDAISDADAATIEPLAVAIAALRRAQVRAGDSVAVIGCGAIGQLLVHAASAQGIRVVAHDNAADKLAQAARLGAQAAPAGADVAALWLEAGVTTVFECAGVPATVELALDSVPRGGQVMLLGLSLKRASFEPFRLVREGIAVVPSLIYDHPTDFARTIELVAAGQLQPSRVVTGTFPLAQTGEALASALGGSQSKVQIRF